MCPLSGPDLLQRDPKYVPGLASEFGRCIPRGSKDLNNGCLAQTILITPE